MTLLNAAQLERQDDGDLRKQAQSLERAADVASRAREATALTLCPQAMQAYIELCTRHPDDPMVGTWLRALRHLAYLLTTITSPLIYPLSTAISFARELVRRYPSSSEEWAQLAVLTELAADWQEATDAALTALHLDPKELKSWGVLGACYLALGDPTRGRACFETIVELGATAPAGQDGLMIARLLTGHHRDGWRDWATKNENELEGRGTRPTHRSAWPLRGRRQWRGEPIQGPLLVYLQDGHGDGMMAARWVAPVRARVGAVRLQVMPELAPLLRPQWPDVEVITWNDDPGEFERYCFSYSLPDMLGLEQPEDVRAAPYLGATETFRPLRGAFRVGLRWAGDQGHWDNLRRSIELAHWQPVLEVPGVEFYSLQLDEAAAQLRQCDVRIHDLSPELTDWSKTAAAMMQLDLIISVDTSVAHLAGALGVPVWICLAATPEWRWMLEGSATPWYECARLFRQPRAGDWESVFAEVARALAESGGPRVARVRGGGRGGPGAATIGRWG